MNKNVVVGLILIALAGVVWLGGPRYRARKEKRLAEQAQAAFAKNDYRNALSHAQQALVINSNNLTASRIMAEVADLSRSPHAMIWRRHIVELEPTLSNRLVFASCALRYEQPPFPIASQALQAIPEASRNDVGFHLVAAQLALRRGQIAEGEKHLEEAIRLDPSNDLHRVNLAVVRLESRDPKVAAQAHADLERFQANQIFSAQASRALMMHHRNRGQFADAERYSTALLRDPSSTFGDKLEHLTVLHASRSPTTNAFLATLEGEASTNVFAAGDLIARMIELGRAADAIAWLKSLPANMQKEEPLPMALASSYFALGRWKELEESLKSQQWKEREFVRRALMAYAERQQNSTKDSAAHWKDAVQLASARPELLGTLAQTAAAWGWTNEAESVLWRAAKEFPKERWPIDALQNGYMRLGNTRALYELTRLAREHQPANVFAQNTWTILSLLLNTNLAQAHPIAKQVHERDAKNPAFATTYAYSLHLQGKTAEALKVMESLSPAQLEEPSIAMYYGLFLAASGQAEKAKHFLAKAEQAVLLPEETQLVAEARKKQATTAAPLRQN